MLMERKRRLPTPESIAVGKRIAFARTKSEHTQETLSAVLGVSSALIAQYETGTTGLTARRADQLVKALGVSMAWLLTGDDPEQEVRAHTIAEKSALALIRELPAEQQQGFLEAARALAKALKR